MTNRDFEKIGVITRRRTLDRVLGRSRTKFDNFENFYFRNYETKIFKSGSIGFFVKFTFKNTHWNWNCDRINMKNRNSQQFHVGPLLNLFHCAALCKLWKLLIPSALQSNKILYFVGWKSKLKKIRSTPQKCPLEFNLRRNKH